jgi:adenylosuccinate synthase
VAKLIVLVSGNVGVGKSTLVRALESRFGAHTLKTREVMLDLASKKGRQIASERTALQIFGEKLDRDTKGQWVLNALTHVVLNVAEDSIVVVDAVRIIDQIKQIRRAYGFQVKHLHLTAPPHVLKSRYAHRTKTNVRELRSYSQVRNNPTEAGVTALQDSADIVIDTSLCTPEDVFTRTCSHLGLYPRAYHRLVDVIVGGQWGSEGKGHIVSYLSPEYSLVVRVGGPNAGHKVFLGSDPYTHHQLPSGTLRSEAKLLIAPGSVLNAEALLKEIAECKVDSERLSIDPQAMIIAPADIARERRLVANIGSTGQGVGYATARRITDRGTGVRLARDVKELKPFIKDTWEILEKTYQSGKKVLIEGTQGLGLSLYHGSYPHVTSRDTSVSGALSEAGIPPSRVRKVIIACRSYPIRVQSPNGKTSGGMGIEIDWKTVSKRSGLSFDQLKATERTSTTNRDRRVAEFNWSMLRRAAALNGPTDIALTFADYIASKNEKARRFEQLTSDTITFIEEIERVAAAPVSLISTRFDFRSIIDRRAW